MKAFLGLCAVTLVSGCVLDELGVGPGRVSPDAVYAAQSVDELIALGAMRLNDDGIRADLSGKQMVEPNEAWTWDINADGTHHAYDNGGEWADAPGGQWQVVAGQFCRENEDLALKCSDVYRVGPFYRFTEDDGSLALWTVREG